MNKGLQQGGGGQKDNLYNSIQQGLGYSSGSCYPCQKDFYQLTRQGLDDAALFLYGGGGLLSAVITRQDDRHTADRSR